MTKEEIVKAIRVCARKLGRNPNLYELRGMGGVPIKTLYKRLGGVSKALQAAGLEVKGPGFSPAEDVLLLDWAGVVRKLKKVPSVEEYKRAGRFTNKPFHTKYGSWTQVAAAFRSFARKRKLERQWGDVLKMIAHAAKSREAETAGPKRFRKAGILLDRPVYGRPLPWPELAHEPVNELGVVFVFGMMARRLGFVVHRLQSGFPDCIAMREVAPGKWQRVRIEFEFESRNFLKHRHRRDKCDVIVCWRHNWKDCPLDVVELASLAADERR